MTRTDDLLQFVSFAGWREAERAPLAGDASNRRYERLTAKSGETAVLMDAPPEKGEDTRPFIKIATYLTHIGLSAPRIIARDPGLGFLLIEDLGDHLFARDLARDPALEAPLYDAAVDVLTHLHQQAPPDLPVYDAETTVPLAALAYDWYKSGTQNALDVETKARFYTAFRALIAPFDANLNVLIQRDYHAENLLWLPEREGVARVGLLDFQDAMLGHPVYDLVSILQDARRDVSPTVAQRAAARFTAGSGLSGAEFERAFAIFGVQRNLRILGVFARLCLRDSKPHYVDLLPRVWAHLQTNLAHPDLAEVAHLLGRDLPAPDDAVRTRLKEGCGRWAGR